MIAQVALALPFLPPFDYQVPPELEGRMELGGRVLVPFGTTERVGYLVGFREESEFSGLKSVLAALDPKPLLSPSQRSFLDWVADYYCASVAEIYETALPGALKPKIKRPLSVLHWPQTLSPAERTYLEQAQGKDLLALEHKAKFETFGPLVRRGLEEGFLQTNYQVKPLEFLNQPTYRLLGTPKPGRKGSKREQLLGLLGQKPWTPLSEVKALLPSPQALLRQLVAAGELETQTQPLLGPTLSPTRPFLDLSPEQTAATQVLTEALGAFRCFLLKGVTGSGKTEVYLHLARKVLESNRKVLILLPEISLTPQAIERFQGRFGEAIAVMHSQMAEGQRVQEWLKIKEGRALVVIGARSAIFAPLEGIGLIVVDEEHDGSYKQQEAPFYHARDLAIKLGQDQGALVILGSATPSVESFHHAQTGKYGLLELKTRVRGQAPPLLQVIDLKNQPRVKGVFYLSSLLYERLKENLAQGRQGILFLNRRGYASCLSCKACETPVLCPHCDVTMTWHQATSQLLCHHCGEKSFYPSRCKSCGEKKFSIEGFGTQRVERDLKLLFPQARFLRLDRDSTSGKGALEESLAAIEQGKVDFVVGTQMIAKGHDFPNVGLVAILYADLSLNIPDIRSSERSFQLFAQVSGRAGRGAEHAGEAWLQTYNPSHFAVQAAIHQDYEEFFAIEAARRQEMGMPPFSRLIQIRTSDRDPQKAQAAAEALGAVVRDYQESLGFELLDLQEAPIAKINNRFYWHLLFRTQKPKALKRFLVELLGNRKTYGLKGSSRLSLDVDPTLFL